MSRRSVRGRVTKTQSSNADEQNETDANYSVHIGPDYLNHRTASALSEPVS